MASLLQPPSPIRLPPLNPFVPLFSPAKPTTLFPWSPNPINPFKASSSSNTPESSEPDPGPVDPVKLAFEKATAYRKSPQSKPAVKVMTGDAGADSGAGATSPGPAPAEGNGGNGAEQVPDAAKIAMEKAKEYRKNKGLNEEKGADSGAGVKVEKASNKDQLVVSSVDFVGLDFGDKKRTRRLPPGLLPVAETFSDQDIKEVEIIVGDTSKFEDSTATKPASVKEDNSEVYKPKYGGGRNIRPGEALETAEERAAKDARTRELLAAYKKKIGLNVDPKLKIECEKVLKDGDALMDSGKLKEALPYYEKIMKNLPFQSEIHGLAALQWSICQDSLTRRDQARSMYEKLQSHPNPTVSKKARQFMFSFQAMEMMKVGSSRLSSRNTGYQNYFEAFIEDKVDYTSNNDDEARLGALTTNAFPYFIFLLSPIFYVLFIALQKGR
ncbi:hypothetical protein CRG98_014914 [Punica granatum]|uniref:Uncharacterized protein n=1 Tax=Punica granatum TaxID=22663 RepID=A0A2I0K824_PUNGR|nr:hypothetical protein CRG98_014914 [Punica granatum]